MVTVHIALRLRPSQRFWSRPRCSCRWRREVRTTLLLWQVGAGNARSGRERIRAVCRHGLA